MRLFVCAFLFVSLALAAGCATVPPLEQATAGIPIGDIVLRVKCELADAFSDRLNEPYYRWMSNWTAKADLTLLANDQAAVTPSGSFTQFRKSAVNTDAGPTSVGGKAFGLVQQFFTFGASGSYAQQAVRTELISFSLSLRELAEWRAEDREYKTICRPNGATDLACDLGLKEWIDAALAPVASSDLQAGNHPPPSVAKGGGAQGGPRGNERMMAAPEEPELKSAAEESGMDGTGHKIEAARRNADDAAHEAKLALASYERIKDLPDTDPAIKIAYAEIKTEKERTDLDLAVLQKDNWAKFKLSDPDPPIDSLSHSVQFVVAYGAGISPNWVLLQWRGPATSGSLASLGGGRHTLNLTLGPSKDEQGRALQTLAIQRISR